MIELDVEAKSMRNAIKSINRKLKIPKKDKLTIEQFLNLSKNADVIVKSGVAPVKDVICRLIFANFEIDDKKVTSFRLNEPFATFPISRNFSPSRGGQIRTGENLRVPNAAVYQLRYTPYD